MNDGRVTGLWELTRPGNAFAAGVLTFIGAFVAGIGDAAVADPAVNVAAAVAATWFATAAGNAINDYFDREIDAINDRTGRSRAVPCRRAARSGSARRCSPGRWRRR